MTRTEEWTRFRRHSPVVSVRGQLHALSSGFQETKYPVWRYALIKRTGKRTRREGNKVPSVAILQIRSHQAQQNTARKMKDPPLIGTRAQ